MDVKLVAIVNSFNRISLLQQGLPSLVNALRGCPFQTAIVVFEAGSTDGSREWIEQFRASTQVAIDIISPAPGEDSSFGAGVNAACAYAACKYPQLEWYFLFETDNWIASPEPLQLATALLESQSRLAAVGFTVCKHSGEAAGIGCPFPTAWQFVLGQQLTLHLGLDRQAGTWKSFANSRWCLYDVVYTSPIVICRRAWEDSTGLDSQSFPFSDCDIDWSWRQHKRGWRTAVLDVQGVVHDNQQTLSNWSVTRVVGFHQARLQLLRRHLGGWVNLLKPLLFLRHCLELVLILIAAHRFKQLKNSMSKRWILLKTVFRNYETA
ncbi:MAG: hypothetical protein H7Y22_07690 [Gemmatimonadaceae bacterium]|nr:hypothetical protein [Gloeobacterales cyanobacterium ES-bin-141]